MDKTAIITLLPLVRAEFKISPVLLSELQNALYKKINGMIDEEIENALSLNEQITLEIPAFFEGVELYQQIDSYPELFEETNKPKDQNASLTKTLVISKQLEDEKGIEKINVKSISGIYNNEELKSFFSTFRQSIIEKGIEFPVAMVLKSTDHAICVGYDLQKDQWQIINSALLPTKYFSNNEFNAMIQAVSHAFSNNGISTFTTEIYGKHTEELELKACLDNWKNSTSEIHNPDKKAEFDSNKRYWLHTAAEVGDLKLVKNLLKHSPPYIISKDLFGNETTPLELAAGAGHVDIVREFLKKDKINKIDMTKYLNNALYLASEKGHTAVATILLETKADPNFTFTEGTALHAAAAKGNADVVAKLLEKKADSNIESKKGSTALKIATDCKQLSVINILLMDYLTKKTFENNELIKQTQIILELINKTYQRPHTREKILENLSYYISTIINAANQLECGAMEPNPFDSLISLIQAIQLQFPTAEEKKFEEVELPPQSSTYIDLPKEMNLLRQAAFDVFNTKPENTY